MPHIRDTRLYRLLHASLKSPKVVPLTRRKLTKWHLGGLSMACLRGKDGIYVEETVFAWARRRAPGGDGICVGKTACAWARRYLRGQDGVRLGRRHLRGQDGVRLGETAFAWARRRARGQDRTSRKRSRTHAASAPWVFLPRFGTKYELLGMSAAEPVWPGDTGRQRAPGRSVLAGHAETSAVNRGTRCNSAFST